MKCRRCDHAAEMMTTATLLDGTILRAYHCFPHWEESYHETIRKDNLNRKIASIETQALDAQVLRVEPPF